MNRPKIVRLYGEADSFDIEFTHKGGTIWTAKVPPDTDDGVYSVELTAVNELGETAYWTGELYMCGGVCHMEIKRSNFIFWFAPLSVVNIQSRCTSLSLAEEKTQLNILGGVTNLIVRKGCLHDM